MPGGSHCQEVQNSTPKSLEEHDGTCNLVCVILSKEPDLMRLILKRVALGRLSLSSPSYVGGNVLTTLGDCDHGRPRPYYTILADYTVDRLYTRRNRLVVVQQLGHLFRLPRRLY